MEARKATLDTLLEIARKAKEKKTGVRALRAIIEGFLLGMRSFGSLLVPSCLTGSEICPRKKPSL